MQQSELDDYQHSGEYPWRDEERLARLYYEEQLSLTQIGERFGTNPATIFRWMEKYGLDRRSRSEGGRLRHRKQPAPLSMSNGYERWSLADGCDFKKQVLVHRLLAVSEFGFGAVCDSVVHHINGVPWDNRPENLELMDQSEHVSRHFPSALDWKETLSVWEMNRNTDNTQEELGEIFGVASTTISKVARKDGPYSVGELEQNAPDGRSP